MNEIPAMTDPLGRYWKQPADIRDAPMDDTHVLLNAEQFTGLSDYSATIPSGKYEGKCWKTLYHGEWYLRFYRACDDPTMLEYPHRKILLT